MKRFHTETVMQLLNSTLKSLRQESKIAALLQSDINTVSLEDLKREGLLGAFVVADVALYTVLGFDDKVIESFDKYLSDYYILEKCVGVIYNLDEKPVEESKIKQHILDTLIGPAWRKPEFYIWGKDEFGHTVFQSYNLPLSYYISHLIGDINKHISSILYDKLCIFDRVPEDRLNKFFNALRQLIPYFKRITPSQEYRKKYNFHTNPEKNVNTIYYNPNYSHRIVPSLFGASMLEATWCIKDEYLKLSKKFYMEELEHRMKNFWKQVERFRSKHPREAKNAKIVKNTMTWEAKEKYPLPNDLKELSEFWDELL